MRRRRHPRAIAPAPTTEVGGATDPGPRPENQDRWAAGDGWAIVCDGVGGHRGGALAAQLALDAAVAVLDDPGETSRTAGFDGPPTDPPRGPEWTGDVAGRTPRRRTDRRASPSRAPSAEGPCGEHGEVDAHPLESSAADVLLRAAEEAHAAVLAGRAADPAVGDMATTLTAAARTLPVDGPGGTERWVVAQVGDSPAWHVSSDGTARAVTWDHSLVGDLVRAGALTSEEARRHPARHVVTRALGTLDARPELFSVDLAPGELLVLASDGLSDVAGPEVVPLVTAATPDATSMARSLVKEARRRRTRDNVTVVVVRRACGG